MIIAGNNESLTDVKEELSAQTMALGGQLLGSDSTQKEGELFQKLYMTKIPEKFGTSDCKMKRSLRRETKGCHV